MADTSGGISYPTVGSDPALIRVTLQDMANDVQRELDKKLDRVTWENAYNTRQLGWPQVRRSARTQVITGSAWLDLETPIGFAGGGVAKLSMGCTGGTAIHENNPRGFVGFRVRKPDGSMLLDAHAERSATIGAVGGFATWSFEYVLATPLAGFYSAQLAVFTDTNDGTGSIVMMHRPYLIVEAHA